MISVQLGETCVGVSFKDGTGKKHEKVLTLKETRQLIYDLVDAANQLQMKNACRYGNDEDQWIPAAGGTETPFVTRTGRRLLYCFNPKLREHGYIDLDTDMLLTNEEADKALGNV